MQAFLLSIQKGKTPLGIVIAVGPLICQALNISSSRGIQCQCEFPLPPPPLVSSHLVRTPDCAIPTMKRCFDAKAALRPSGRYNYTGPQISVVVNIAVSGSICHPSAIPRSSNLPKHWSWTRVNLLVLDRRLHFGVGKYRAGVVFLRWYLVASLTAPSK